MFQLSGTEFGTFENYQSKATTIPVVKVGVTTVPVVKNPLRSRSVLRYVLSQPYESEGLNKTLTLDSSEGRQAQISTTVENSR